MLETGTRTNSMELVRKSGQMEPNTKASTTMERSMARAHSSLLTEAYTREALKTMKFLHTASISGRTARPMKESGKRTECMAKAFLSGETENTTMASLLMTKEKATASFGGRTAGSTRASGKTASSTELGFSQARTLIRGRANGTMGRNWLGWNDLNLL